MGGLAAQGGRFIKRGLGGGGRTVGALNAQRSSKTQRRRRRLRCRCDGDDSENQTATQKTLPLPFYFTITKNTFFFIFYLQAILQKLKKKKIKKWETPKTTLQILQFHFKQTHTHIYTWNTTSKTRLLPPLVTLPLVSTIQSHERLYAN